MSEFVDRIRPEDYDQRSIPSSILDGTLSREEIRERVYLLNLLLTEVIAGLSEWAENNGYRRVFVPNIVSTIGACENWRTLFKVNQPSSFFHLLTQTGQLFLEATLTKVPAVWCLTKSFRKEEVEDQRHLNEFHLFEIEGAFGFADLLDRMRGLYKHAVARILAWLDPVTKATLGVDDGDLSNQLAATIPEVPYAECIARLRGKEWGKDLTVADETNILAQATDGRTPVFITRFPAAIKFFNMAVDEADPRTVLSVDLILPRAGEAAGGAERESNYGRLADRLETSEMYRYHISAGGTYEDFLPYMTLIRDGRTPRHSGCGIGMERILQSLLQADDIRLCSVDYLTKILFAWDALRLPA